MRTNIRVGCLCICALGVVVMTVWSTRGVLFDVPRSSEAGGESEPPPPLVFPEPGSPRPWQGSMPVSPFSVANLVNGNLLTVVPFEGLSWGDCLPGRRWSDHVAD